MAGAAVAPWLLGYTGALYGWTAIILSALFVGSLVRWQLVLHPDTGLQDSQLVDPNWRQHNE